MPQTNVNIVASLNEITKDIFDGIRDDLYAPRNNTLYNLIASRGTKKTINTEGAMEFFVADSYNYSIVPGGRNVLLPNGQNKVSGTKARIGIKQFYGNAEITANDIEFAQSDTATYIDVVERALNDLIIGRDYWLNCCTLGNGSGQIATCALESSVTLTAGSTSSNPITFDNTYLDLGWDGVTMLRHGLVCDVYQATGSTKAGTVLITTPIQSKVGGVRTGTAYVTNIGASSITIGDNYRFYLPDTFTTGVPMGLRGIINPALHTNPVYGVDGANPFQSQYKGDVTSTTSIARNAPEGTLFRSQLWRSKASAASSGTAAIGLVDDSTYSTFTGETLQDWDAGTLREIISNVEYQSNNPSKVDCLLCNVFMQEKMYSISRNVADMQTTWAGAMGGEFQTLFDIKTVGAFMRSDGTTIPVIVDENIPNNEIIGLSSQDLIICDHGNFDFLRRSGDIWEPTYSNGKDNYQAPYKGFVNFGAYRCDGCFDIQGLKSILD